uniref:Probable arginine--tRNA ligase, mitochondrial n=1 Tax=Romanomermis culicivorax TaxID=13658 RepID=A0A915KAF7_ROMCU
MSVYVAFQIVLDAVGRSDVANKVEHVKFGKIRSLSTRRGKTVFVDDMIRQGIEISAQVLSSTPTTKSDRQLFPQIARQLALSAFLINDFKRKRTTHYSYDWEKVLRSNKANIGHLLQACHARLCSLEEKFLNDDRNNVLLNLTDDFLTSKLVEPEALTLIDHLTKKSYESFETSIKQLDPSSIVSFLCDLAHSSNAAHKKLKILNVGDDLANARLLLFSSARMHLAYYLKILGLDPIEKL